MNNRYFIRIKVCGRKRNPRIITMEWYDNPDMLLNNLEEQFKSTVFELSEKRGKYMKKLAKKGVDWFKKMVDKKVFDYRIEVIRFNHSFDNFKEFDKWISDSNIISTDDILLILPGDLQHRKMIQDYATDYYMDIYDYNFNKIDSVSLIHDEVEEHRRTGTRLNFKKGDKIRYSHYGKNGPVFTVIEVPEAYDTLYWHDGYVDSYKSDPDMIRCDFDDPDAVYKVTEEDK